MSTHPARLTAPDGDHHALPRTVNGAAKPSDSRSLNGADLPMLDPVTDPATDRELHEQIHEEIDGENSAVRDLISSLRDQPAPVLNQPGSVRDQPGPVLDQPGSVRDQPAPVRVQPGSVHGQSGSVHEQHFRSVLGRFATGVVAITAIDPVTGEACGLAANSFASVSLDPPLVSFCVSHTSTSWPLVKSAKALCVNVLAEHQQSVSARLATSGGDKFAGVDWSLSPGGSPVLDGALAWIDCTIEAEHPAGDHVIVVARVQQLDKHEEGGPLIFFRGGYGGFHA